MEIIITLLWVVYFGLIVCALLVTLSRQNRLYRYLNQRHHDKWVNLTTIGGFGPGARNTIKGLEFLLSEECYGDPQLKDFKKTTRYAIILFLVLSSFVPCLIIISILLRFAGYL